MSDRRRFIYLFQMYARDYGFSISKDDISKIFNAFCDATRQALKEGTEIRIPNVGLLYRKLCGARAVNDFDGNKLYSPAHYKASFKMSSTFKDEMMKIEVTEEAVEKE